MLFKFLLVAALLGHTADGITTGRALSQGFVEANPALAWAGSTHGVLAVKGGVVAGTTYGLIRMHRTHPKRAIVLTIAFGAVGWGAAEWNRRTMARGGPR